MKPPSTRSLEPRRVRAPPKFTRDEYQQARRLTEGLEQLWLCDDPCDRKSSVLRDIDGFR